MKSSPPVITAGLCASLWASLLPANAADVILTTHDGLSTLKGELLSTEGGVFSVQTGAGVVSVLADSVNCTGAGCPPALDEAPAPSAEPDAADIATVAMSGADIIVERLLPDVLDYYSRNLAAELTRGGSDNDGWRYTLRPTEGEPTEIFALSDGSERGIADLIAGRTDLALVSRPMTEGEAQQLVPEGLKALRAAGLESVLATDGLVVVADPSVGVTEIELEDVARVFAGDIRNWRDLGGPDVPITPFAREAGSGTRDAFNDLIMRPYGREISERVIGVDNDKGIADAIIAFPGSIGVTSYYNSAGARTLALREPCGLVAEPDPFAMQTGRYPLTRYLYAYRAPGRASDFADRLVEYMRSQAGQEALDEMGYIGQRITSEGLEQHRARLALAMNARQSDALLAPLRDMVETLITAERLSPTVRPDGPRGADVLADEHVARLAREIAAGSYDGREILFVGFTDDAAEEPLAAISESRIAAERVMAAVAKAADVAENRNVALKAFGYGTLSPLACSGTPIGSDINRRVEVWSRALRVAE